MCRAWISSTPVRSSHPSAIIARAPTRPSSPGWKKKTTVPLNRCRSRASVSATPTPTAVWMSCPQACAAGRPAFGGMIPSPGTASMSAR